MGIEIDTFTNGDDVFVHWRAPAPIEDCLGFAVHRKRNGKATVLNNYIGFVGDDRSSPQSSNDWPTQRFRWIDHLADQGDRVSYKVVARIGTDFHDLRDGEASDWSAPLTVGPGGKVAVYFNRGIVASQWVSRLLGGGDTTAMNKKLGEVIKTAGDPVRAALSGYARLRLLELLASAKSSGAHVYASLYELDDPELVPALSALKSRAHVVLANGSKPGEDENSESRAALAAAGVKVFDRMVPSGHLSHHKFLVITDAGDPRWVWTGSTNWTKTGLCTQANNALVVDSPELAAAFKKQWDQLKKAGSTFPASLLSADDTPTRVKVGRASLTAWFAPTSSGGDLDAARALLDAAEDSVFFLMFNPGPKNTLLNKILDLRDQKRPDGTRKLYIRGVINQDPGGAKAPVLRYGPETTEVPLDKSVLLPAAIEEEFDFWRPELKKYARGFAMVHSKVVVIDPFGKKPVLMTGSHNLGPKASGKNDDNLVILEGSGAAAVAQAHVATIMSIYDTYHWREWQLEVKATGKPNVGSHLRDKPSWQNYALLGGGRRETDMWFGGPPPA